MSITQRFDTELMAEDLARKGWLPIDLASKAGVAPSTVGRFLNGEFQTARTAKRLADALGYSVRRYIVSPTKATASDTPETPRSESVDIPSPVGDRRNSETDRRLGGRRRSNRDVYPDRRKEARR